jgi:hypothetical protein
MRSCNEVLNTLSGLVAGQSALHVALTVASERESDGTNPPAIEGVLREYEAHRADLRDALLRRLGELKPYLDGAIDAVEHEIAIAESVPARQRLFRHTQEPDYVGPDPPEMT